MLSTTKDLFLDAEKGGYALGAFNFSNLEILQAIVGAAEEAGSDAILALSEGAIEYGGFENLLSLAKIAAGSSSRRFAIHLDHGRNRETIKRCMESGFTSVMFDGSNLPFEENVGRTREVVEEAAKLGVSVEGELGRLKGVEDDIKVGGSEAFLTDPEQAREFVERTGVDSLAVAVGTSHGTYKFKGETRLDFDRLRKIDELIDVPLVLHGASRIGEETVKRAREAGVWLREAHGVSDEAVLEAIRLGVRKINIDTDMRLCFTTALRETLTRKPEEFDPRKILAEGREAVFELVKAKVKLFSSCASRS